MVDIVDTKIVMNNRNCKVNVMNKTKKNYKGFHNPLNDNFNYESQKKNKRKRRKSDNEFELTLAKFT